MAEPMTLHEAQYEINKGVSGSDPAFVSLKQVFDAASSLVAEGFLDIVGERPPGRYDIERGPCRMHVTTGDEPLLTFRSTPVALSVVSTTTQRRDRPEGE